MFFICCAKQDSDYENTGSFQQHKRFQGKCPYICNSGRLTCSQPFSQVQWYLELRNRAHISSYSWQIIARSSVCSTTVESVWNIRSCGKIRGLLLQWATKRKKLCHRTEVVKCLRRASSKMTNVMVDFWA